VYILERLGGLGATELRLFDTGNVFGPLDKVGQVSPGADVTHPSVNSWQPVHEIDLIFFLPLWCVNAIRIPLKNFRSFASLRPSLELRARGWVVTETGN
jgi:hypothetical protein